MARICGQHKPCNHCPFWLSCQGQTGGLGLTLSGWNKEPGTLSTWDQHSSHFGWKKHLVVDNQDLWKSNQWSEIYNLSSVLFCLVVAQPLRLEKAYKQTRFFASLAVDNPSSTPYPIHRISKNHTPTFPHLHSSR